jgi:PadR family transcriptional regulator, regulatory protein PadR
MTLSLQLVLRALLEDPMLERYGLEICEKAGLASGTIHPILARLEREQILEAVHAVATTGLLQMESNLHVSN